MSEPSPARKIATRLKVHIWQQPHYCHLPPTAAVVCVNLVVGKRCGGDFCISQGFDTQGFLQVARGLDYSLLWKSCPHQHFPVGVQTICPIVRFVALLAAQLTETLYRGCTKRSIRIDHNCAVNNQDQEGETCVSSTAKGFASCRQDRM
jgi:hypothetical protein